MDDPLVNIGKPVLLWSPEASSLFDLSQSNLTGFVKFFNGLFSNDVKKLALPPQYSQIYEFSITEIERFWYAVLAYSKLHLTIRGPDGDVSVNDSDKVDTFQCVFPFSKENVLAQMQPEMMSSIPRWFPGVSINFAENILCPSRCMPFPATNTTSASKISSFNYDQSLRAKGVTSNEKAAIIGLDERGREHYLSYGDLAESVRCCANALRQEGVNVGDRVVGYIANIPHAVVFALAAASLGAVWSGTSPDFGVTGVLERFKQVAPKILVSVNAVYYNGKKHDHLEKLDQVIQGLPMLKKVILVNWAPDHDKNLLSMRQEYQTLIVDYEKFLLGGIVGDLTFTRVPFNHPLYILYSSGTTGLPKCLVHSVGGTLLQHLKEHRLHGNLTERDVVFQYTTTGWMMWNWLVSVLAIGATIVLYDGSPFSPEKDYLWRLASKYGFTVFGTSAKYLQSMQEFDIKISSNAADSFNLSHLHSIYSTGSPLSSASYDYVYSAIKKDVLLGSITGGTDIISLFAGHCAHLPVYRGEIQCRCLGMAVESWDDQGKPVYDQSGDLVCIKPFPSMPVYFWDDADGCKYKKAYFESNPKVWSHGDFVCISSKTKGVYMLGRSDGTLKPGGVRFGSAEIYNIVNRFENLVADSLVVGQKRPALDSDERVVLFLKMKNPSDFTESLVNDIKKAIRTHLSPRHVPMFVLRIDDIPYTINGKKVEVAVKKIVSGQKVVPSGSLANPESLKLYENIPEIQ